MTSREMINELLARMRLLETDHAPEGWPAVQMKDITALCDEIERLQGLVSTNGNELHRRIRFGNCDDDAR